MAAKNNEFFWRLYLLLHDGCPLVSKKIILRELAKSGYDLDQLLFDNKQLLERNYGLSKTDIKVLFPGNKKTELEYWGAHLFPCVILTLFSKSLQPDERKNMRSIRNVQKDIEVSMSEASLDPEAYDDHTETLSGALLSLARVLGELVENEIADLINVFITQPLNPKTITGMNLPAVIKVKLLHFLEKLPSYIETIHSEGLSTRLVANSNEGNTSLTVLEDINTNVIYERVQAEQPLADENTCIDVHEAQESTQNSSKSLQELRKPDNIEFGNKDTKEDCLGSEEDMTGFDKASKGIASEEECLGSKDDMTELDKGSDEIVTNASKPLTEEERKITELLWKDIEYEQSVKEKSFVGVIDKKMSQWEPESVHVAVIGRTGVGKSRFINAIRSISKEDSGYAPVGNVETTVEAKAYPHPENNCLKLWDLPGIGTDNFPREDYVKSEKISFKNYHIYLIMASDRFTQDDTYLAGEIEKIGKIFLFVRTRVDRDLEEIDDDDDVKGEIKKIRDDCSKSLSKGNFDSNEVYLISSKNIKHPNLDFGKLLDRLVNSLDGLKKEVLLFSLQFNTSAFIESKATVLRSRIYKTSIKSAGGGAIPVPGFSLLLDCMLISDELDFYRSSLGITDGDLEELAEKTKKNIDYLKTEYKLQTFEICKLTSKDATKLGMQIPMYRMLKQIAMSEAVESTSKLFPVVGSVAAAAISGATTYHFLKSNLDMMLEDARKMLLILLKETGSTVLPLNQKKSSRRHKVTV